MHNILLITTFILAVALVIPFYRVAVGPTVYIRFLDSGVIGISLYLRFKPQNIILLCGYNRNI